MKRNAGFLYPIILFLLAPSPASSQLWTSLHEMPSIDTLCVFDADSARFAPGTTTLFPYVDGSEMDSTTSNYAGWWDVIHKTSYPENIATRWGISRSNAADLWRPAVWRSDIINSHAVVEFNHFHPDSARNMTEKSTSGITPWSDFMHQTGSITFAIVFNTIASPSTETQLIFYTSVASNQRGIRLQTPSGSDATKIVIAITNGATTIVTMSTTAVLSQGNWQVLVFRWRYNHANYDAHLWVDSLTPIDSVESTGAPSALAPTLTYQMRGTNLSQSPDSLRVAMFAVSDSALIDSDIEALISYLSCRFDLGVSGVTCPAPTTSGFPFRRRGLRRTN